MSIFVWFNSSNGEFSYFNFILDGLKRSRSLNYSTGAGWKSEMDFYHVRLEIEAGSYF